MVSVAWLHLSDWHEGKGGFDRDKILEALKKDIYNRADLHSGLQAIDFIVFSGDIANTGDDKEYDDCKKGLLSEIILAAGMQDNYHGRIFMCPGNHDLQRSRLLATRKKFGEWDKNAIYGSIEDRRIFTNEALKDEVPRSLFLDPFQNFRKFSLSYMAHNIVNEYDPSYYVVHHLSIGQENNNSSKTDQIAVACMNTAWLSGRIKNPRDEREYLDYGHLVLGEQQMASVKKKIDKSRFDPSALKIAVLHHPVAWLDEFDSESNEEAIIDEFHFLLTGHHHSPRVNVLESTAGGCIIIPAGACFDRRFPSNPRHISSYNFVRVDIRRGIGEVYLRRWNEQHGGGQFQADESIWSKGVFNFNLPDKKIFNDVLRRRAFQSLIATQQKALARRIYESVDIRLNHKLVKIGSRDFVQMTIIGRLVLQCGDQEEVRITTAANARVAKLLKDDKQDYKILEINRIEQIIPRESGQIIKQENTKNKSECIVVARRERTIIEYEVTILEMTDGVCLQNIDRSAQQLSITINRDKGLDYEETTVGGLELPLVSSEPNKREWFDWVSPGQGYLLQWYPSCSASSAS